MAHACFWGLVAASTGTFQWTDSTITPAGSCIVSGMWASTIGANVGIIYECAGSPGSKVWVERNNIGGGSLTVEADPVASAISGILKSNGSLLSAAVSGTDYVIPAGNVATATALAANGSNCSVGSFPLGVNASGASESCATVASAETDSAHDTCAEITSCVPSATLAATYLPLTGGTMSQASSTPGEAIFFDQNDPTSGNSVASDWIRFRSKANESGTVHTMDCRLKMEPGANINLSLAALEIQCSLNGGTTFSRWKVYGAGGAVLTGNPSTAETALDLQAGAGGGDALLIKDSSGDPALQITGDGISIFSALNGGTHSTFNVSDSDNTRMIEVALSKLVLGSLGSPGEVSIYGGDIDVEGVDTIIGASNELILRSPSGSVTIDSPDTKLTGGEVDVDFNPIVHVSDPTNPQDAETKAHVAANFQPLDSDLTAYASTANAPTATALAANGSNCSAGSFPLGVNASGAVESCATVASAETDSAHDTFAELGGAASDSQVPNDITIDHATTADTATEAATIAIDDAGADSVTYPMLALSTDSPTAPAIDTGLSYNANANSLTTTTFLGALTGNASTASALAADPAGCTTQFAIDINAAGVATCASVGTAYLSNDAITYAKIQNVSATDKLLGRSTAGAGDIEEIACDATCRDLLDDTSAGARRTTLGLAIGVNVQAYDGDLDDAADGLLTSTKIGTGSNCYGWGSTYNNSGITAGTTTYMFMNRSFVVTSSTESSQATLVVPVDLKFTALYASGVDPGGSAQSVIVTLRDDSADVAATTPTCTINTGSTTCQWTGLSGTVAAGSLMDVKIVNSASAASQSALKVSWCTAP